MRKLALLSLLIIAAALPLQAERGRNQSYISVDEASSMVRQGDGQEIAARVNMPVYPGDEIVTGRRGRTEIRLSDGNMIALDRATSVVLRSVLDSYEGDASQSVVELRYGKAMLYRAQSGGEAMRLDTATASYFASRESVFSVEADSRAANDRVIVFDGSIEVRTPSRTTRIRASEGASVDARGLYELTSNVNSADDFERWFLNRVERYTGASSRYLDSSFAYYDDDLTPYGSWSYINGYGWGWRPSVTVGWRPYYNGHWSRSRWGSLVWVSYEPWGWMPYHYGRWSYDPFYGWFWLPGGGYSPAWVYWMYGSGYVGWAPAGWYDCYRPYYNWAYRPYANAGWGIGFGFYGRVHVNEIDLRPWTFVDRNTIVSTRVDRAALTADAIRGRLVRDTGGLATVSNTPARFVNERLRDPAAAAGVIGRSNVGGGGPADRSTGAGAAADMTPFFRRDPELSAGIRERVTRNRADGSVRPATAGRISGGDRNGGGTSVPIGGGSVAPIGGGGLAPVAGGSVAPIGRGNRPDEPSAVPANDARIPRGGSRDSGNGNGGGNVNRGAAPRGAVTPPRDERQAQPDPAWRERVQRPSTPRVAQPEAPPQTPAAAPRDDSWRNRTARPDEPRAVPRDTAAPSGEAERRRSVERERGSDVPRRVIDGIGGARIYRGDGNSRGSGNDGANRGASAPPPRAEPAHSSPPPQSAPPPSHDSGASRGEGGRVQRNRG